VQEKGLRFITNPDERGSGSFPEGTTWVNGTDAVEELARMMEVRRATSSPISTSGPSPSVSRFQRCATDSAPPISFIA